jgi:hypothetical protein
MICSEMRLQRYEKNNKNHIFLYYFIKNKYLPSKISPIPINNSPQKYPPNPASFSNLEIQNTDMKFSAHTAQIHAYRKSLAFSRK